MKKLVRSVLFLAGLATLPACASSQGTVAAHAVAEPISVETQAAPVTAPPALPLSTTHSVVVYFDSDNAEIRASAMQVLYGIAQETRGTRLRSIRVIGHADSSGRLSYNQRLSEKRAHAVADQLNKLGLHGERFDVIGLGEAPSTGKRRTGVKSAADRKVEIIIESVEDTTLAPLSPSQGHAAAFTRSDRQTPSLALASPPAPSFAPAPALLSRSDAGQLRQTDKPAIKRNLYATGTTWLPPPA